MTTRHLKPTRKRHSRVGLWLTLFFTTVLIGCVFAVSIVTYGYLTRYLPTEERAVQYAGLDRPIIYNAEWTGYEALGEDEGLMLPYEMMATYLDRNLYYEEASQSVIVTTPDQIIHYQTDQLTAMMNDQSVNLQFPVRNVDGQIYLPIEPLATLYQIHIEQTEQGAVVIWKSGESRQWGYAQEHTVTDAPIYVRTAPSIKQPIVAQLSKGESLVVLEQQGNWSKVQLVDGEIGYMFTAKIQLGESEQMPDYEDKPTFIPWKPDGPINLTWEAVYNVPARFSEIGDMPGLNVVSPTWFELAKKDNGELFVQNKADPAYVAWAKGRGYQVWGLFSNAFDPDLTSELLATYDQRAAIIRQILSYAKLYQLQGINLDFENVYLEDKELFTQFVREITPWLHEQNLVVSIDVTIRGGSAMWSQFIDRQTIGEYVDYMIVMTYDEHWAASPIAGSVASLPWVEKGMTDIRDMDEVPASKLIVGVPFYTRIWTEDKATGKVSSRAVPMQTIVNLIEEKQLEPEYDERSGQHYVEYVEEGNTIKIWIEDERSMRARAELVSKHEFAGIASWRRGFELPGIWTAILEGLQEKSFKTQ